MGEPDWLLAVVSAGRPGNVPAQLALWAPLVPIWYVPEHQAGDYAYCGAGVRPVAEIEGASALAVARNAVLDDAHGRGRVAVMTDDDLVRCAWSEPDGTNHRERVTAEDALGLLLRHLCESGALFAGAAPTDNPFFTRQTINTTGFIRDGFTAHLPNPLRYDTDLRLTHDYDMTLQHLTEHGQVCRLDSLLMTYRQRNNSGGVQDYREPDLKERDIERLLAKWPGSIVRHATRAHEVSIRWRAPAA